MYDRKRTEHLAELQKKEEEMRQTFVIRVKETEGELKDAEKEVGTLTRLKWKKKKKIFMDMKTFLHVFLDLELTNLPPKLSVLRLKMLAEIKSKMLLCIYFTI